MSLSSPSHPLNALPPGHMLQGEYRIAQVLGAGGFGITYLATDGFSRPVAIKEYLPNELAVRVGGATQVSARAAQDADDFQWGLRKFREEGAKLAAFDHPHINRVLRLFEANGTAYLVLEYVHGRTLSQVLAQDGGRLEQVPLQRLLTELLQALQVVHGAGLVHCDIKPANIMLREEDGAAVLLDFGASRQAVSQRTRSATSAFTPPYAALEQYEQDSPDLGPWTDLYGLGMVAYRCISGSPELQLPEAVSRLRRRERDIEPAITVGAERYPQALLKAVDWALALQERDRPQSAEAMAGAIGLPTQSEQPTSPPQSMSGQATAPRRWQMAALAGALALLAALAGYGYVQYGEQQAARQEAQRQEALERQRLAQLELELRSRDLAAWTLCSEGSAREPCSAYLRDWPAGQWRAQAEGRIAALEAERLVEQERARQAAEQQQLVREEQAWQRCRDATSRQPCDAYLRAWPQGRFTAQANERVVAMAPPPQVPPQPVTVSAAPSTTNPARENVFVRANLRFDAGSSQVRGDQQSVIRDLVEKARAIDLEVLIVVGHADSREGGSEPERLALSKARAEAVKLAASRLGIPAPRIYAEWRGSTVPVADSGTAEGRSRNRRVEAEVVGTRLR